MGAGHWGTLTAVNILRQSPGEVRVILVDRNTWPGRGLAYRSWDDNFQLRRNLLAMPPARLLLAATLALLIVQGCTQSAALAPLLIFGCLSAHDGKNRTHAFISCHHSP